MSFDWSPFSGGTGEFVKFEEIGDDIVGTIVAIRTHDFGKGLVPLLDIEPKIGGDPVTLSIDKVDLKIKIADLAPQVGDMLAVRFTGTEKTPNGTKKVFDVRWKKGERPEPEPEWDDTPPGDDSF